MKLNFTKQECKTLLEMIYFADWMLHAHEPSPMKDAYHELEQKIMRFAKELGYDNLIDYSDRFDEYSPSSAIEESDIIRNTINDYDNETFWDEIIFRLGQRDVLREHSEEELAKMSMKDRFELFWNAEKPYSDEFECNGLNTISIQ